ncbi:MAG: hypothetical protein ACO1TE_20865 [Prosthecobacter sp.]
MSLPTILADLYGDIFSTASISETPDGALLIRSAPGRYMAWVLAFPVILLVTRWCWRRGIGGAFAPGFFFASFTIPLIIVPMLALESVRITPRQFTMRTGFWFAPTVHEVPLTGVVGVSEVVRQQLSSTGKSERVRGWHFRDARGEGPFIPFSDLLRANRAPMADYLGRHGHPVRVSPSS